MGSHLPSFFSKKRFESGLAFGIFEWGSVYWLLNKAEVMTTSDYLLWAGPQMVVCGYIISKIEDSKKSISEITTETSIKETVSGKD